MTTIADLLLARAGDDSAGLMAGDETFTWSEVLSAARARQCLLEDLLLPGPPHVAVLLGNVPEYVLWIGAAALAGAAVVGANPTHRGRDLARDLSHTACQLLVTDSKHLPLVDGLDLGPAIGKVAADGPRILVVDSPEYMEALARALSSAGAREGAPEIAREGAPGIAREGAPEIAPGEPAPTRAPPATASRGPVEATLGFLVFTSGTSGAPKACRCSQGRLASIGSVIAQMFSIGPDDVCYVAMPLFHSNALMAGLGPAIASGAAIALPSGGRFSASGFLPDVRRYGATYFNYVGKPLTYVLATPERPDDADNTLTRVFGNEGSERDVASFARRFGCAVVDSYGSTEGGAVVQRTPDTPPGALGRGPEGTVVVNPETGEECPRARFDSSGRLANPGEATGELVSKTGAQGFEGYWENEEAERARTRGGWYWTGDLAYRDEEGFFYFAGRSDDWMRVDGENFAAAPVARILERHRDVALACVYAVPDPTGGDQVMAALELRPGTGFDGEDFARFLAGEEDMGTKWAPRYVRICESLPTTATSKVLTRALRAEGLKCADPLWWRPGRDGPYVPFEG